MDADVMRVESETEGERTRRPEAEAWRRDLERADSRLRGFVRTQPFVAAALALAAGWMIGRVTRS